MEDIGLCLEIQRIVSVPYSRFGLSRDGATAGRGHDLSRLLGRHFRFSCLVFGQYHPTTNLSRCGPQQGPHAVRSQEGRPRSAFVRSGASRAELSNLTYKATQPCAFTPTLSICIQESVPGAQ